MEWMETLAVGQQEEDGQIVDAAHLEDACESLAQEENFTKEELQGFAKLMGDCLVGKKVTVGFLRRVNGRLAEKYLENYFTELKMSVKTASRRTADVGDLVFAKSGGEPGKVIAVIGTGSPSFVEVQKEYGTRYGLDEVALHENAKAMYRVIHADNVEELYYDTEVALEPSQLNLPKATSEAQVAPTIDSSVLKEALHLWWDLLSGEERKEQFVRQGADLGLLKRLEKKFTGATEGELADYHTMLNTAYRHVKALPKKEAMLKKATDIPEEVEFVVSQWSETDDPSEIALHILRTISETEAKKFVRGLVEHIQDQLDPEDPDTAKFHKAIEWANS